LDELKAGPLPAAAFFDSPKSRAAFRRLLGGRRVTLGLASIPSADGSAAPGTLLVTGGDADSRLAAALEETREAGAESVLVLAPETYRVAALRRRCEELTGESFEPYHSEMSPAARWRTFGRCRRGTVKRVVGTRSALFLPLPPEAAVIMTDEAHSAYKQWETSPYYVAREVAGSRAARTRLVLAAAAPSLETYVRVTAGGVDSVRVPEAADGTPLRVVDMSKVVTAEGPVILSAELAGAVRDTVREGGRALVMVNRRGYVPYIYCDVCGEALKCDRCDVAFTYHREERALRCHYCSRREPLPRHCPSCGKEKFAGVGFGSEKLAREVELLSDRLRVARVDSDALRTPAQVRKRWEEIAEGKYDVVVGTQMARRALEHPAFTLAALASADTAMNVPDFRASERTYRTIRRMLEPSPGRRVIVQTFFPEHYAIAAAAAGDYEGFARREMAFRKRLHLPPFSLLVNVVISETKKAAAKDGVRQIAGRVKEIFGEAAEVVGPLPAPVARTRGTPRRQILVKTSRAEVERVGEELAALAHRRGPVGVKVDVDPYDLF
jgi:primosomal protein N' (replication factor Y)